MTTPSTRSLDKALSLLALLARDRGAATVSELAGQAGLPPATAHRIIATLERRGFVTRIARGRYLIGPALIALTTSADLTSVISAAGRPILDALARSTGLTAHLGVLVDDMVTYLVKAGGGDAPFTREGMQLEAYCSGIGKVLLASLPHVEQERYLSTGPFVPLTPNTIVDPAALRRELGRVRRRGHAFDRQEIHGDLACIAVPIRACSGTVAAISLASRAGWDSREGAKASLAPLRAAADRLERRLFPDWPDGKQSR